MGNPPKQRILHLHCQGSVGFNRTSTAAEYLIWGGQMLYTSEPQKSSGLPLPAECLRQSTEGSLLRKKMIRSNLLRDRGCIFSCQQLMKQECQLTGESKSGQKKGEKKICSSPLKSICFN